MKSLRRFAVLPILLALPFIGAAPVAVTALPAAPVDPIPSPEEFFGFSMGTSQNIARWDDIVEYFELIDANSERVQVTRVGDTTLGNPYLSVAISSPENMRDLPAHQARAKRLARGHGLVHTGVHIGVHFEGKCGHLSEFQ